MDNLEAGLWIFGYGSLIFKADFPFEERSPALIDSWKRRFWQASRDHRGTPNRPGRVVTLSNSPGAVCWGMAYRIAQTEIDDVLDHLDYREKGGYQRLETRLHLTNHQVSVTGITYLADEENSEFLGPAPLEEMAHQILHSVGPSGKNVDYLFNLEASLKAHNVHDEHVFALANQVRQLLQK